MIQSAFVSNPNFAHIENNIAAAINKPLKRVGLPIEFRSREFAVTDDKLLSAEIDMPFWLALEKPGFETARDFMKKAITQRDNGGPDPAVPASKALEAVLRQVAIRSGVPSEKFIASSVLAEKICAIGLIDDWEKEAIKLFFAKVRNPLSHGVAEGPIPTLSDAQTYWAIRYCMITILRLIS